MVSGKASAKERRLGLRSKGSNRIRKRRGKIESMTTRKSMCKVFWCWMHEKERTSASVVTWMDSTEITLKKTLDPIPYAELDLFILSLRAGKTNSQQ
jgi:hypothetical protein